MVSESTVMSRRLRKWGSRRFVCPQSPDVVAPACRSGCPRQNPKHVLMFCPDHARNRPKLFEAAGTYKYREILSTGNGLRAVARWVMSEGVLTQCSLAKEQTDRVEGRAGDKLEEVEQREEVRDRE